MAVVSAKELARTFEQEVGRSAILKRRWVCVLDDATLTTPTSEADILTATTGTAFGVAHPGLSSWKLRKVFMNEGFEGSPYHVEVVAEYSVVRDEEILAPVDRPAQWSFEAQQGEFPALFYYDPGTAGSGNGTKRPLTNSAYDYFPGLTTQESLVRGTVVKNFAAFPSSWFAANNFVNSATYLGCAPHTLKVAGISTNYAYEEFNGAMVKYWATTANLLYRESGHNLQLPDVGWNFIDGTQKRRAMVFDFQNSEWVASPNPVGLDGFGAQTGGAPAVLNRRVNPETAFLALFGAPPS
jgi:hypothetical protein